MSKDLEILNNDDVISVISKYESTFFSGDTLKPKQLLQEFKVYLNESNASSDSEEVLE